MAVRNIKGIGSQKPIPIHVWIPPAYTPIYKIVVSTSSQDYDITDYLIKGEYTDGITETIGSFAFTIDNSTENYTTAFSLYDEVKVYIDYGATASTLRFTGLIERVSKLKNQLVLTGRSSAMRAIGKNVSISGSGYRSTILEYIVNTYFSGVIGTAGIETDAGNIEVNYSDTPFWDIIQDLCKSGGRSAYVDKDYNLQYFISGSRENTTEAIVHDQNLISVGDFSPDLQQIYNKVRVYGAIYDDIPIIATATSDTTLTKGDIKELTIVDRDITSYEEAQARANAELDYYKDPPTVGEVTSLGLPTLQPGEKLRISDPPDGLEPKAYEIQSFTHKFSNDEPFQTTVTIKKERNSIPYILRDRIKFESSSNETKNPNDLDYSVVWTFDEDVGTHDHTRIVNGILQTDGSSTGTWISPTTSLAANMTRIEVKVSGTYLQGRKLWISANNGTTWNEVPDYGSITIPTGKDLKLRIDLPSATTEVTAAGLLYSL